MSVCACTSMHLCVARSPGRRCYVLLEVCFISLVLLVSALVRVARWLLGGSAGQEVSTTSDRVWATCSFKTLLSPAYQVACVIWSWRHFGNDHLLTFQHGPRQVH